MSFCCPFKISLGQSEHSVALIIKKPFKSGWVGKDRERMNLYTRARAATLAVQAYCWCLEVGQRLEYVHRAGSSKYSPVSGILVMSFP